MTFGDILVLSMLGAGAAGALRSLYRHKGRSCCGSCRGCKYAGNCRGN